VKVWTGGKDVELILSTATKDEAMLLDESEVVEGTESELAERKIFVGDKLLTVWDTELVVVGLDKAPIL
jgi:hypothetical protein